ncbi:unnamed protein product [Brassica oleracea var. botrytis]
MHNEVYQEEREGISPKSTYQYSSSCRKKYRLVSRELYGESLEGASQYICHVSPSHVHVYARSRG